MEGRYKEKDSMFVGFEAVVIGICDGGKGIHM
jgi:hypothetical protein